MTCQLHPPTFLAIAMSSPSINLIALISYHVCQPRHPYICGTLPPNCLKTRIAMMPVDQTDEACRSNIGRGLGGIQSISMVTTQPFANCERAVECQLTYSVFYITSKPSSARG